jgi:long-subunit fatty acid transport protein
MGFSAVKAIFESTVGVPDVIGGDVLFAADTWGYGGNIALMYRPFPEKFHIALTYRSRIRLSFDGKMDVSLDAEEFGQLMHDQTAKTELWLPDTAALGLMYSPVKPLEISLDTNMLLYYTFDKFEVKMADGTVNTMNRGWRNVVVVRLGIQYELPVGLRIRVGTGYDQDPAPDGTRSPDVPESQRVNGAAGLGYEYKWFKADVGYMFSYFLPAKSTTGEEGPAGEYRSHVHLLGLTLGIKLGDKTSEKEPPRETEPAPTPSAEPEPEAADVDPATTEPEPAEVTPETKPAVGRTPLLQ